MSKSILRRAKTNATPTIPSLNADVRAALIAESSQAWEHYRHIENQRNSYIGFFLTAILGFIALIGSLSAIVKSSFIGWPLLTLGIGANFFGCLSVGIFLAIRRFNSVLNLYAQIIVDVRNLIFSDAPKAVRASLPLFSIYGRGALSRYDEQMIAEAGFAAFSGIFASCSTAIAILAFIAKGFTSPQQIAAIGIALFGISIFVFLLFLLRKTKRTPAPALNSPRY